MTPIPGTDLPNPGAHGKWVSFILIIFLNYDPMGHASFGINTSKYPSQGIISYFSQQAEQGSP